MPSLSDPAAPDTDTGGSVTVSDPGRTITVTSSHGIPTSIQVSAAALSGTETDLCAQIVAVATFCTDRDEARNAARLIDEAAARGDDPQRAWLVLHRHHGCPTSDSVTEAYNAHYNLG